MKKKKSTKWQTIKIKELDDEVKSIGKYNESENLFECKRDKTVHFQRNMNAWGLDARVAKFLFDKRATIHLIDVHYKWTYEAKAEDFMVYGIKEEYGKHLPQIFLPLDYWKIIKIKDRTLVLECDESDCRYNFCRICTCGAIKIGKEGVCNSYEDN